MGGMEPARFATISCIFPAWQVAGTRDWLAPEFPHRQLPPNPWASLTPWNQKEKYSRCSSRLLQWEHGEDAWIPLTLPPWRDLPLGREPGAMERAS